jgi:hypothetical protein
MRYRRRLFKPSEVHMGIFSASAVVMVSLAVTTSEPKVDFVKTGPSGAPTFEQGVLSTPLMGELGPAALSWALERRTHYGLAPATSLKLGPVFATRFGASVHLLQTAEGIEVEGAKVVVTVDEQRRVVQVASSLTVAQQVDMQFRLKEGEAIAKAMESVPYALRTEGGQPMLLIKKAAYETREAIHASYLAHVKTLDFSKNWYVGIDAVTGRVLFAQNRVLRQSMEANVYPISPGGLDAGVGRTPTQIGRLVHPDGGSMVLANDGGFLNGTQLTAYNCCVSEDCRTDAGSKIVRISFDGGGMLGSLTIRAPVCSRAQRASNDSRVHASGDYRYDPVDSPFRAGVSQEDPSNSDEFSEVHAFYHANRVYDWLRGLSSGGAVPVASGAFALRDERAGRRSALWTNFILPKFPDFQNVQELIEIFTTQTIKTLARIDNAAFLPREQFQTGVFSLSGQYGRPGL